MNWRRRIPEWTAALREERRTAGRVPWWTMVKTVLKGTVPRRVWQTRLRTCLQCPMYRKHLNLCKSEHPQFLGLGCHCVVWAAAMFPNPHGNGCFAYNGEEGSLGWPRYRMRWWEWIWSPVRFALRK